MQLQLYISVHNAAKNKSYIDIDETESRTNRGHKWIPWKRITHLIWQMKDSTYQNKQNFKTESHILRVTLVGLYIKKKHVSINEPRS